MDLFLKLSAGILLAVILYLVLSKQNKEVALLLSILVCCLTAAGALRFLEPVLAFAETLQEIGRIDAAYLAILLKVVGIGFLGELAALVCNDAGNASMGKMLQILTSCVILWVSLPLLNALLELVQNILGEL